VFTYVCDTVPAFISGVPLLLEEEVEAGAVVVVVFGAVVVVAFFASINAWSRGVITIIK